MTAPLCISYIPTSPPKCQRRCEQYPLHSQIRYIPPRMKRIAVLSIQRHVCTTTMPSQSVHHPHAFGTPDNPHAHIILTGDYRQTHHVTFYNNQKYTQSTTTRSRKNAFTHTDQLSYVGLMINRLR